MAKTAWFNYKLLIGNPVWFKYQNSVIRRMWLGKGLLNRL
jgi:hypothetical protein